jgi:hypothetical protein
LLAHPTQTPSPRIQVDPGARSFHTSNSNIPANRDRREFDRRELPLPLPALEALIVIDAAGDIVSQIIIAMGEGSKAGLSAFDYLIRNEAPAEIAQVAQAA